jgi:hypothetical protein
VTIARLAAPQSISSIWREEFHAADSAPLLDEPSLGLERRLVDRTVVRRRLIDLRVAHLALRVGAGRQDFVRDAVWNLRTLAVGVLSDALVEPRAKIWQRVGQPLHRVRPERQQPAVGHRFHGGVVRESRERRHLAEVLARAESWRRTRACRDRCETHGRCRARSGTSARADRPAGRSPCRPERRPARAPRARCRRRLPREVVRRPESL